MPAAGRAFRTTWGYDEPLGKASLDGGSDTWGFRSNEYLIGPGFEAQSNDAFGSRKVRRILVKSVASESGPPVTNKCSFLAGIMPASCASFNSV